jgi:hypothetical protein
LPNLRPAVPEARLLKTVSDGGMGMPWIWLKRPEGSTLLSHTYTIKVISCDLPENRIKIRDRSFPLNLKTRLSAYPYSQISLR